MENNVISVTGALCAEGAVTFFLNALCLFISVHSFNFSCTSVDENISLINLLEMYGLGVIQIFALMVLFGFIS
jgi:hypothetical protein